MKQRQALWCLVGGLLVAAILSACQSGEPASQPEASSTTSTSEGTTTTAVATMNRQAFLGALERIGEFSAGWNSAGLGWLAAYSDDAVTIEDYLEVSYETELSYRRLIADLVLDSKRFPTVMQDATNQLLENYQGRADAFHRVIQAEVAADNEAWVAAADEYFEYSNPEAVYELLEEVFTTPEIEATLAEIGMSVDDVLDALAASFGVG